MNTFEGANQAIPMKTLVIHCLDANLNFRWCNLTLATLFKKGVQRAFLTLHISKHLSHRNGTAEKVWIFNKSTMSWRANLVWVFRIFPSMSFNGETIANLAFFRSRTTVATCSNCAKRL